MDSLKKIIYTLPSPPPRARTKPLTLICVGPPRSATESLSVALTQLGLKTYHGWDLVFEEDAGHIQTWANLAQRKFSNQGVPDGDVKISRAEFDAILGDVDAVIDLPASIFAAELIAAYPEAKVILNTRRDLDAWRTSVLKTIVSTVEDKWSIWLLSIFSAELYWTWEATMHYGIRGLFRNTSIRKGVVDNGKWIYREHCNMVRGLVSDKERLLEWSVEDGWAPLCKFLNKKEPTSAFPKTNDPASFAQGVDRIMKPRVNKALRNLVISTSLLLVFIASIFKYSK